MDKKFFILIGRSGSGKGTQAAFLQEFLKGKGFEEVRHTTTGSGFRALSERDLYTAKVSNELTLSGGLGPEFLAIWNWSNIFIENLTEKTTVILDGAPRRMIEVEALHGALTFYGYQKPVVVYLDVSEAWALEKLESRGREDDVRKEERERKMKWFFDDVLPCVAHYKNNPLYEFVRINGEQSIEEVSAELKRKMEPHL
jgi:adenylate kinase family enzyme